MKIGVIDIGSNSVRLMLWADGKTLYKKLNTTRLGEGLERSPYLLPEACERTARAVAALALQAEADGAQNVYAFATAAVRSSKNSRLFLDEVRNLCGIEVDVLSGEKEAEIGLSGALGIGDGGIIDVGGASTEVTVRKGGKVIYTRSVNIGTVRILDAAGRDLKKIMKFIAPKIGEYGDVKFPDCRICAIGGTASRLAAIKCGLREYTPGVTDGTPLSSDEVLRYAEELTALPVEQIRETTICKNSADVIGGGAALLYMVMKKFAVGTAYVSEKDNLEGYAQWISGGDNGGK